MKQSGGRNARQASGRVRLVTPIDAIAAAYVGWVTPDLPLYGLDHDRADFAP
ncbi:hypothetical protein GCM10010168_92120 [Actinoplanes ianthinogenes]|uniref:Uncharacterized protein n=1 Tax=Actinoplanes ianthinogenes TaxID=122358 RepID=A0ABM7LNI9_9ACTN|nr:hypothetical protein Aiant_14210 [Actinoplanes ianthinogenes]GGR58725.1 hypothetical protein GCM10010168_92120 [Actinoplanes ianthinogenes]